MLKKVKRKKELRQHLDKVIKTDFDNAKISWNAPEYADYEKGAKWKIGALIILILSIIISIAMGAWSFALVVLVFAAVYYLVHREDIKKVDVKISDVGIKFGLRKYPFTMIEGFWIIYNPPLVKTLNLRLHGKLLHDVIIQLEEQTPEEVRTFLKAKATEFEGRQEYFSDAVLRFLKL